MSEHERCANCHFFDGSRYRRKFFNSEKTYTTADGICRRFPPVQSTASSIHAQPSYWTSITHGEGEWCGEFKQRVEPIELVEDTRP